MKLNPSAFALSCGILWGVGLLLLTWWIMLFDGSSAETTIIGRVYRGYSLTFAGSLIGLAWAFIDGVIGGFLFAWIYNWLAGHVEGLHVVRRPGVSDPGAAASAH